MAKNEKDKKKTDDTIFKNLLSLQRDLPQIEKTKEGKTSSGKTFLFAPLSEINKKVFPLLNKYNLLLQHKIINEQGGYSVVAILSHIKSNEKINSGPVPIISGNNNITMQELGARITYARRYSTELVLGIVSEEDQDIERISSDKNINNFDKNNDNSQAIGEIKKIISYSKNTKTLEEMKKRNENSKKLSSDQKKEINNLIVNKINELLDKEMQNE